VNKVGFTVRVSVFSSLVSKLSPKINAEAGSSHRERVSNSIYLAVFNGLVKRSIKPRHNVSEGTVIDQNPPIRTFGMNHVLVGMCFIYATSQLIFHPEQRLVWSASLLMALGYLLLLTTNGFLDAFRTWIGRTGLVIVVTAWALIFADHFRSPPQVP
jgi:hypothetical protein